MSDPWSDPGVPYAGPPPTTPPHPGGPGPYGQTYPGPYGYPYGPPQYGGAPYGYPYGYPGGWAPYPPAGPRRPGQVLAAAVLAFVQAGVVAVATVYVFLFVSVARIAVSEGAPESGVSDLAGEGSVLGWLQLASVVLLVAGGILALGNRRRRTAWLVLAGALIVQLVLSLYWGARLATLGGDLPGPDPAGVFAWFALFFAAMPVVALALVGFGPGRRWFREEPPPTG